MLVININIQVEGSMISIQKERFHMKNEREDEEKSLRCS